MLLFVGLGNPGSQYTQNRHNIGFVTVDAIIRRHSFGPPREKFSGIINEGSLPGQAGLGDEKVVILRPLTFMNLSGEAVGAAMRFYKLKPQEIVVFHDDLDLAPGKLRVKQGGGHGGHNGLRSIDAHIGKEYRRVRLGIGHPGDRDLVTHYVLGNFAREDHDWLRALIETVAEKAPMLTLADDNKFATAVALKLQPPKEKVPSAAGVGPGKQED